MTIDDLMNEGLSLKEAVMAIEAYYSARLEGAAPITAKRYVELIRGRRESDA